MFHDIIKNISSTRPVLIAGPTASGKSALALAIAQSQGGVIVNADASQVYDCWRVITARPSTQDEAAAPHALYGHVPWDAPYSAGTWLREVLELMNGPERVILVGGTGLYFAALTEGLAQIPEIRPDIRAQGDQMALQDMLVALDPETRGRIDMANPARVQRAWEVQRSTGRGLAEWQDDTPAPALPISQAASFVMDAPKEWLTPRIEKRFSQMLAQGALDEVAAMAPLFDPTRPAFRAIGVPELTAHLRGEMTLEAAETRVTIATRQYAKRQRTWLRKHCAAWTWVSPTG